MNTYRFNYLKVLVVDDNRNMTLLVSELLHALGVGDVVTAPNGEDAIEKMIESSSNPFDIVIADLNMEPVTGAEFLKWIRREDASPNRFVPFILLTGHTELQKITLMRDLGVTEVLAKPISVSSLSNRLLSVIDRPRRFVESSDYFGPDRRRRSLPFPGPERRRSAENSAAKR